MFVTVYCLPKAWVFPAQLEICQFTDFLRKLEWEIFDCRKPDQYNSMHTIYISLDLSLDSAPTTVRKAKIQTKGDDYDSWEGLDGFSAQT